MNMGGFTGADAICDGGSNSDRVILDAANVICYFNYVNRLVMGLGIQLEADGGGGYKY